MLRDASQRASPVEPRARASCCDAPQHEGEVGGAFWRNEATMVVAKRNPTASLQVSQLFYLRRRR